jgi:hypothetical protein
MSKREKGHNTIDLGVRPAIRTTSPGPAPIGGPIRLTPIISYNSNPCRSTAATFRCAGIEQNVLNKNSLQAQKFCSLF